MRDALLKRISNFFRFLCSGYYKLLLLFSFLLFIFRPYTQSVGYIAVWKLFLAGMILSSIFNCHHKRKIQWIALSLAVPSVIFSWLNLRHPEVPLFVAESVCTILFMVICVSSILYDVVLRAHVTLETLRGVICAYFMLAFAFAYAYYLIEYLQPGTFQFTYKEISAFSFTHFVSEMLYFSFVTLLTIGFGDIAPAKDLGQTVVVMEGIVGQFYVAILVARIVSVYSFYSDKRLIRALERHQKKKN